VPDIGEDVMGFMLYVDGKPSHNVDSFEEAQQLAAPHIANGSSLRIECFFGLAPSRSWIYDDTNGNEPWVEPTKIVSGSG
jgi:hypothetical protein